MTLACLLCTLIQASKNPDFSSDPVLFCFSHMRENCKMVDKKLLFKRFIISCVKDLKISMKKNLIEKDKLSLIEQWCLTEHPACNYKTSNVIMTLQI